MDVRSDRERLKRILNHMRNAPTYNQMWMVFEQEDGSWKTKEGDPDQLQFKDEAELDSAIEQAGQGLWCMKLFHSRTANPAVSK